MIRELLDIPIYFKYKIKKSYRASLEKYAVKHLGVKNIYALKDRYEGQSYFEQFLIRSYAEIALQEYLGKSFFVLSDKENKSFVPKIYIGDRRVKVISVKFGEYPVIPKTEDDYYTIAYVNLIRQEVWLVGSLDVTSAKALVTTEGLSPLFYKKNLGILKDLTVLKPIV